MKMHLQSTSYCNHTLANMASNFFRLMWCKIYLLTIHPLPTKKFNMLLKKKSKKCTSDFIIFDFFFFNFYLHTFYLFKFFSRWCILCSTPHVFAAILTIALWYTWRETNCMYEYRLLGSDLSTCSPDRFSSRGHRRRVSEHCRTNRGVLLGVRWSGRRLSERGLGDLLSRSRFR